MTIYFEGWMFSYLYIYIRHMYIHLCAKLVPNLGQQQLENGKVYVNCEF